MKKIKWYYKVIFVSILLFIISSCTNKGFIINANAKEPNFYFNVEDSEKLKNYNDKLFSNFAYENDLQSEDKRGSQVENIENFNNSYYSQITGGFSYLDNYDFSYIANYSYITTNIGTNFPVSNINSNEYGTYINRITYGESNYYSSALPYFRLFKGKEYELLLELKKDSSTHYRKVNPSDIIVGLEVITDNSDYHYSNGIIDTQKVNYFEYSDNDDNNYAYLYVRFRLNDEITSEVSNYSNVYNSTTSFFFKDLYFYVDFDNNTNRLSFAQKLITSTDSTKMKLKVNRVSFLENGYINFTPGAKDDSLDNVNLNDLVVFNELNECDSLDLSCHFENLTILFKNLITRIGNFFTNIVDSIKNVLLSIFIPDLNKIKTSVDNCNSLMHEKFGILFYPFDLILNIYNRFTSLSSVSLDNIVISIPEIKAPFYENVVLIHSNTWNFGSIIHTGNLYNLYLVYRTFITAYIILLFINFCIDSFHSFITGNGGMSSSFTDKVLHELAGEDNYTGYEISKGRPYFKRGD